MSEVDAELGTEHHRVIQMACAAGLNDVLEVGLNEEGTLAEIEAAFMRMGGNASDLKTLGWNGDGNGNGIAKQLTHMPGIVHDSSGDLRFAEWNCRAGQNNVIIRTDGTVAPYFPMYASPYDWGNIDHPKFDDEQLADMKKSCQRHCFSTLNHNLAY